MPFYILKELVIAGGSLIYRCHSDFIELLICICGKFSKNMFQGHAYLLLIQFLNFNCYRLCGLRASNIPTSSGYLRPSPSVNVI